MLQIHTNFPWPIKVQHISLHMRHLIGVIILSQCFLSHAADFAEQPRLWSMPGHSLVKDLTCAGIMVRDFSFNIVDGAYYLDLQYATLTNLNTVAAIIKRHDLSKPPAALARDLSPIWEVYPMFTTANQVPVHNNRPYRLPCSLEMNLCNTDVSDVTALRDLNISLLWLANTPFGDLTSLKGMPIKDLHIRFTNVKDLAPLSFLPIEWLFFNQYSITNGLDVLRGMKTIKGINGQAAKDFWPWYDAIMLKREPKILEN